MKLSVVVPARNEERCLRKVITDITEHLRGKFPYEIIIVNDNSIDKTGEICEELSQRDPNIKVIHRKERPGFGRAVKEGLNFTTGEAVVICMGDGADEPGDIVKYYNKLEEGYDCVFGSRFTKDSLIKDYPAFKLILNRIGNTLIRCLFLFSYNDITNAFKMYRKEVITFLKPFVSDYFEITVEIPLKSIIYGFSYTVVPINWYGRKEGVSKYNLLKGLERYFFTIFYIWFEKILHIWWKNYK